MKSVQHESKRTETEPYTHIAARQIRQAVAKKLQQSIKERERKRQRWYIYLHMRRKSCRWQINDRPNMRSFHFRIRGGQIDIVSAFVDTELCILGVLTIFPSGNQFANLWIMAWASLQFLKNLLRVMMPPKNRHLKRRGAIAWGRRRVCFSNRVVAICPTFHI